MIYNKIAFKLSHCCHLWKDNGHMETVNDFGGLRLLCQCTFLISKSRWLSNNAIDRQFAFIAYFANRT